MKSDTTHIVATETYDWLQANLPAPLTPVRTASGAKSAPDQPVPSMKKSQPAKVLLDTSNSGIDNRQPNPLMTVEVVRVGERFKAVLVALQPLGLNQPPVGDDRIAALAREIVRRARYQLLPFSEREKWKGVRNCIVARALELEGMTQADLMRASPEEMIGRFIDMTRKRRGNAVADLLQEETGQ